MHTPTHRRRQPPGFTLMEVLVVIGMLAILASTTIVAINPGRQFAQARNAQRTADVHAIASAVGSRLSDGYGEFSGAGCSVDLPATSTEIGDTVLNIEPCLVPDYLAEMPVDPSSEIADRTGYYLYQHSSSGRITVCAPAAAEPTLRGSEPYCVTR